MRRRALSRASALLRELAVWHLVQTKKAHLSVSLFRYILVPAPGVEPGTY